MADEWQFVEAYFAQPGSEARVQEIGHRQRVRIDTGAEITAVGEALARLVYGAQPILYTLVHVQTIAGVANYRRAPLLVAIQTNDGGIVHAQVDCLLVPNMADALLGADVLSRLGLAVSFDYQHKRVELKRYTWGRFEDEAAEAYRVLGARVRQNVNLAGFQVDMLVEETTPSRQQLRMAVECKFYQERIGNRVVNDFARVVATLKDAGLVDRGIIVSFSGFTQDASLVAAQSGVELVTLEDLRQRHPSPLQPTARQTEPPPERALPEVDSPPNISSRARRVFVVMPFAPELEDVYHLGIRESVQEVGGACERADEIQYTGGILEKIYDSIRSADAVIAEISTPNPNVYYEVGFAHALGKPVVLLTKSIDSTPFDLRGYRHIVYGSIIDLRKRLAAMLPQVLA
jgi:hypothetical protein